MGQALERRAGGRLRTLLDKMTSRVMLGFLTGLGVTAIIQSSSATTVMVVGFVNSGLMTLRQAINVIMGANVGTTVTAWFLSLDGHRAAAASGCSCCKPDVVHARAGADRHRAAICSARTRARRIRGSILLGFTTLMFGMETMSGAVAGLRDVPAFTQPVPRVHAIPLLGVLVGALVTAVIQSSSGLRRHPAGAVRHRRRQLCRGHPHHHGPEHRHLRHGAALVRGDEQERAPRRHRPPAVQRDRRDGAADGVLHREGGALPRPAR